MVSLKTQAERWLDPKGPVALVRREFPMPVEGRDAVFFPPTYAGDKNPYNIDELSDRHRPGFRPVQEAQHADKGILLSPRTQVKPRLLLASVEDPHGLPEQNVGGLEETDAGEHLPGVEEVDGNGCLCHASPRSFRLDAFWSAARRRLSSQARPHGPKCCVRRSKRSATWRARSTSLEGGSSASSIGRTGLARP